jgi:hypothetical protein
MDSHSESSGPDRWYPSDRQRSLVFTWRTLQPPVFVSLIFTFCFYYGGPQPGSVERATALFILIAVPGILFSVGFPPAVSRRGAFRFWGLVLPYFVVAGLLCVLYLDRWKAVLVAIVFAIGGILFTATEVLLIAYRCYCRLETLLPAEASVERPTTTPILLHLTDVHVTQSATTPRFQGGPGGLEVLRQHLALVGAAPPRLLIISGDITDRGLVGEWDRLRDCLEELPPNQRPFLALCPGNHDLTDQYRPRAYSPFPPEVGVGIRLYFEALARLCPMVTTGLGITAPEVVQASRQETAPLVAKRYEKLHHELMSVSEAVWSDLGTSRMERWKGDWKILARETLLDEWFIDRWRALFPLEYFDGESGSLLILLNTVRRANNIGESALGAMGAEQFQRLSKKLDNVG